MPVIVAAGALAGAVDRDFRFLVWPFGFKCCQLLQDAVCLCRVRVCAPTGTRDPNHPGNGNYSTPNRRGMASAFLVME